MSTPRNVSCVRGVHRDNTSTIEPDSKVGDQVELAGRRARMVADGVVVAEQGQVPVLNGTKRKREEDAPVEHKNAVPQTNLARALLLLLKKLGGVVDLASAAKDLGVDKNDIFDVALILYDLGIITVVGDNIVRLNYEFTLSEPEQPDLEEEDDLEAPEEDDEDDEQQQQQQQQAKGGEMEQEEEEEQKDGSHDSDNDSVAAKHATMSRANSSGEIVTPARITIGTKTLTETKTIVERNKHGKLIETTATVVTTMVIREIPEPPKPNPSEIGNPLDVIFKKMSIVQGKKQLDTLNRCLSACEKQISSYQGNVNHLYIDSAMIEALLTGPKKTPNQEPENQYVLLRGPPGAELNITASSSDNGANPQFQMKLKSPRGLPLESYLLKESSLTDLFQVSSQ